MEQLKEHIKKNNHHIISLIAILIAFTVPLFFVSNEQTGLLMFFDSLEEGVYENTTISQGYLGLDNSNSGTYLSNILQAEDGSEWDNISWSAETADAPEGASLLMNLGGTLADASGNGNEGFTNGEIAPGKIGDSLYLDGEDDYMTIPTPTYAADTSGTVSLWLKNNGDSAFFYTGNSGTNNNYMELKIKDGKLAGDIKSDKKILSFKGTSSLAQGEWLHIAFTSDQNGNKVYVNAEEYTINYDKGDESTHAWLSNLTEVNETVLGVSAQKEYEDYLDGSIDELAIWNRRLTAEEIQDLYKIGILNLTLEVKSCDNSICEGAEWNETTDFRNDKYVQYRFSLHTDDINYTPKVYNVTVNSVVVEKTSESGAATGNITTDLADLSISVNGNGTLENLTGKKELAIYENSTPLMTFNHNFSAGDLNLSKIKIDKAEDHILLKTSGELQEAKTIYLENNEFDKLCLKDAEINSISEISESCTGPDETDLTACLGNTEGMTTGSYYCKQADSLIEVRNVTHSALRGTKAEAPAPTSEAAPSAGGSGGGGGRSRSNSDIAAKQEEKKQTKQAPEDRETIPENKQEKVYEQVEVQPEDQAKVTVQTTKSRIDSRKIASTAALLLLASVSGVVLFRRQKI